jgi:hypothetical protein
MAALAKEIVPSTGSTSGGRALAVLYVITVVTAMTGWIWFLAWVGLRFASWLFA